MSKLSTTKFKLTIIQNIIENIGLTEKESAIYIACLKLGNGKVGEIASLAKVNRVTCYTVLEKLIQKGLVIETIDSGIKKFEAVSPQLIYDELQAKTKNFKSILSELKKIHRTVSHPTIRYFEGIQGVKIIYEDTLNSNSEILSFANSAELRKHWPNYDQEYVLERVKKKIYLRGIAIDDEVGQQVKKEDKLFHRKIKLIPAKEFQTKSEINIYDNKVAYTSFNPKPMGIIIEDKNFADTQKSIFEMIWHQN